MGELHTFWLKKGSTPTRQKNKYFVLKKWHIPGTTLASLTKHTMLGPQDYQSTIPRNIQWPKQNSISGLREMLRSKWSTQMFPECSQTDDAPLGARFSNSCGPLSTPLPLSLICTYKFTLGFGLPAGGQSISCRIHKRIQ